jgi:small-conductance mechanosensitive channel
MRSPTTRRFCHQLLLCGALVVGECLSGMVFGQTDSLSLRPSRQGSPVLIDGDTLFFVHANLGPFTPEQRAAAINARLQVIVKKARVDSVMVVESTTGPGIFADGVMVMAVTDDDTVFLGKSRAEVAGEYATILREHIILEIQRYSTQSLLVGGAIAAGLLFVLALGFWVMAKLFPRLYARLEGWEGTIFRPIRIRSQEILSAGSISGVFIALAKTIRLAVSLAMIYFFITYTLTLFPLTQRWNVKPILIGVFLSILTTTVAIVLFRMLDSFHRMSIGKIGGWKGTVIKPVKVKTIEVLSEDRIAEILEGGFKILRLFFYAALSYVYITILFSFFEFTQTWAGTLFGYIIDPLWNVVTGFVGYLPNIFYILVIAFVTRYAISFTRFIFGEIGKGTLAPTGFYPEWADPTFKIVRFLILAFAGIVIFPYLPGSDSPVFRGVSVFLGILLSLGSTSAIANVVAGVVLTYMRPFKIGDRVKIAETVGDINEKTLLVTRVRTIKNVDITIPNAMVLGSHIINFSSSANDSGLILHTGVTIGYDAPWKKVHELLIAAAGKTQHILKEPKPFVLQTSLDDFYVSYELNAYTDQPILMATIYSEVHQNIQNAFNEAGVEIMSPHYSGVRDGNRTAIPETYLPKSYKAPAFRIFPIGDMGGRSDKPE